MKQILSARDVSTLYLDREADGQPVVLKVLNEQFPTAEQLARFINELDITQALAVDGVRRAIARTRLDDRHALVLQYVEGEELTVLGVPGDRRQLLEFIRAASAIARMLGELHLQGVIHRDIKPSNVLLDRQGRVRLIDFGLATRLDVKSRGLETPGQLVGTLAYLSPEQTGRMNRTVDYRTDLYSLGVTFYQLLTGRLPFEAQEAMELVYSHLARVPAPPDQLNPAIPAPLSRLVMRLIEKNPEDRYQSALGLEADLTRIGEALELGTDPADLSLVGHEVPLRFALVEKLYGREFEVSELLDAFERQEGNGLVCISGASGAGKTALVAELYRPITARRGRFVKGKFDQLSRNVPYHALSQAFGDLVAHLLTSDEAALAKVRLAIREAVGELGRALSPLVPNLEVLIGAQPEIPTLEGTAAQNRLRYVLRRFVGAVCGADQPLVVFVDDLQWADLASLDLIEALVTDPACEDLHLIGAYRDNEVAPGHLLATSLESLAAKGAPVRTLTLSNLSQADVRTMIADATRAHDEAVDALARLVHEKTAGNAFFVHHFLHLLAEKGLLAYAREARCWQWDLGAIAALHVTDNVVDLLTGKLHALGEDTREALQLAACIGDRFDLDTLAKLLDDTGAETARRLWPALAAGLVAPIGDGYRQVEAATELATDAHATFAFAHDRVQQAAYALREGDARKHAHLKIARILQASFGHERERLFEIARHFNQASDLVTAPEQRLLLAHLNLEAARTALASSAFAQAVSHGAQAFGMMPPTAWQEHYALTLSIHQVAAEAASLLMDLERTQAWTSPILSHATSPLDRAKAYEAVAMVAMAREDLTGALDIGLKGLAELGVRFPASPKLPHVIKGMLHTMAALKGRIETLASLPELADPRAEAALGLLDRLCPAAFRSGSHLFPLFVFSMVRLSVRHGRSRFAPFAFASFAIAQCAVLKDYAKGYRFATLANTIGERYPRVGHRFIFNNFIRHWQEPLAHSIEGFLDTYRQALECGDLYQGTWSACYRVLYMYALGTPLSRVKEEYEAYADVLKWDEGTDGMRRMVMQQIANLTEEVPAPHVLDGAHYDQEWVKRRFEERHDKTEIGHYQNFSMQLCYLFGATDEGLRFADAIAANVDGLNPMHFFPFLHVYSALLGLRAYRSDKSRRDLLVKARQSAKLLDGWAKQVGVNYAHLAALVRAEIWRSTGETLKARKHYDLALQEARANQAPIQDHAILLEACSAFYEEQGQTVMSQIFLKQAVQAYQEWGATAIVRRLVRQHPHLTAASQTGPLGTDSLRGLRGTSSNSQRTLATGLPTTQVSTSGQSSGSALDLQSILKASSAIGAEIVMERLVEQLLRIMCQNAGAQRGALLLMRGDTLRIEASIDGDHVFVGPSPVTERSDEVASSIVQYVTRTREPLLLADASVDPRFMRHPSVAERGVRSVLCAPILHQGRLSAMVYLENNAASGTFTNERLQVIAMLSAQAGISLENAQLYRNLEEKVAERTREIREEKEVSERLLLNILPRETAEELKRTGRATPRHYDEASVLFTDFKGFTSLSEKMDPAALVAELDRCFQHFDEVMRSYGLEKIKTIGDAYMCAGGIPVANRTSAVDCVLAGLTIQRFMIEELARKEAEGEAYWQCRLGIHTGPVIAGVVGKDKFAYDIWGDTVNTASRMESSGEPGRVNVSAATYERIKDFFACSHRGNIAAKGKGEIAMYFVEGILPELSVNGAGKVPNTLFLERRRQLQQGEGTVEAVLAPPPGL